MARTLLILALALSAGRAAAQDDIQTDPISNGVRQEIERHGYRDVRGLAEDDNGIWHGRALRGNTEVQLLVDHSGNVSVNR